MYIFKKPHQNRYVRMPQWLALFVIFFLSTLSTSRTVAADQAPSVLVKDSYGKSHVRLTKVIRDTSPPRLKEITVDTELLGDDFASAYYAGDNRKIITTDAMKNTVYVVAAKNSLNSIEEFALTLAKHYLDEYADVKKVIIKVSEDVWSQIPVDGKLQPTAFVKSREDDRVATITMDRQKTDIESGIENLNVVKITDSEFNGFLKDQYTTLKETNDRIFGTKIDAHWRTSSSAKPDFNSNYENVRKDMLETFAKHHSLSAQHTLYAIGDEVLKSNPDVEQISLVLPNLHRIPFDLQPFRLENRNEIFVTTSEPYGIISGTIARKK